MLWVSWLTRGACSGAHPSTRLHVFRAGSAGGGAGGGAEGVGGGTFRHAAAQRPPQFGHPDDCRPWPAPVQFLIRLSR